MTRSLTEAPNPLTLTLDTVDAAGMVRMFRQTDAQMFAGFDVHPSLFDEVILEALARFAWKLSRVISDSNGIVVLSGAGTSGRFAHLLSMEFNKVLAEKRLPEVFRYTMAGGEAGLIQAQEAAEDSVPASVEDLKSVLPEKITTAMYIGITAGLSAPYVAGQVDYCLGSDNPIEAVIVGFNPASAARDRPIEGWDKTVKDVVTSSLDHPRFLLLNPVYGPEGITGSTRMKGGSMTKIVLETGFLVALEIVASEAGGGNDLPGLAEDNLLPLRQRVLEYIRRFRTAVDGAYSNIDGLSTLVRMAGTALRSGGRIHYIGRGAAGILGIIDASECPPTFGAGYFDVRGYLREGWESMGFSTSNMRARGKAYEIGHDYFEQTILPDISKGDLVIGVAIQTVGDNTARLLGEAARKKADTALLLVTTDRPKAGDLPDGVRHHCVLDITSTGPVSNMQNEAELTLKLALNAISSGGHVLSGKVYNNVMIDLRISNAKLYDRAIGLISALAQVTPDIARAAMHHAVFKKSQTQEEIEATPVTACVSRAVKREKIVPLSILLSTGRFTLEQAEERLAVEPRVRRIIEEVLESS
ncbi:MAG: hypothetical protein JJU11_13105 [Candidatus Sumerlaeia bacterium]|nr:hypothetical protein [Candidatus Sumerlaeia bacterium]